MNRILYNQKSQKYEILITPYQIRNAEFEYILGNWTDPNFSGFYIIECFNIEDAYKEASKHPNIDWVKLYLLHKDNFEFYYDHLNQLFKEIKIDAVIYRKILHPQKIKMKMFKKVKFYGDQFRLLNHFYDIFQFVINIKKEYNININNIKQILNYVYYKFVIISIDYDANFILLKTDIGTTYSIILNVY